ncbi:SPFH domain-containing protein [Spirochaeta isovalerica]|uniref:Membrane protease subunit (Stomatin/prohibitin family) n=1 Tax=Spirochaeta isovalerica TaxID=150 RepID=A0A841RFL2_9SPIO|nr:SPFH domain-containing protein [Spirochaeta isovalerica]MBB6482007.1 membrane protease subunit (stomatin/prohibitin family) [Spirochaeta isovalerica]
MGLFDKIKGEFIDIIEWTDDSSDTIVYRFERYGNEIKNGAKLTVRESQAAVFINEGKLADVFQPGMYELTTANLPILSTLKGWAHGFNSPFKAEVYFVNTKRFTDLKWGTQNPIMLRDAEFGPIRLRAFGSYSIRVTDPSLFLKEVVGTDGDFTTDEVVGQLRNIVVSRFTDALGESKIPALDLAANYDELGKFMEGKIGGEFGEYGLELVKLLVENISLPPAVEEALDKRSSMGILGNLNQYSQFQAANAMEAAANNPSGTASGGIGMGMGFAMANQMGQAMNQQQMNQGAPAGGPPPVPPGVQYYVAVNGQQTGPFDLSVLAQKAASGELTRESLVWKNGMAAWTAAGSVGDLSSLFGQVPPPLPPQ